MGNTVAGDKVQAKAAARLFASTAERSAFIEALGRAGQTERFAPCVLQIGADPAVDLAAADDGRTPEWMPTFARRLAVDSAPGKHPAHEQGRLYALDFSSIFSASALQVITNRGGKVLDVCAAPGGKTIFAHMALRPSVLISNEVIGKRLGILRHNLKRCGIPCHTQRRDASELARLAADAFDVVLVDAPCSGQSLLAKGIKNPGCFHKVIVNRNVRRQRRVLAESAKTVAPGGHLFYSTCTFAEEENERVIAWLLRQSDDFVPVEVPHLAPWQSPHADFPCFRLYPQSGLGAGAFCALLRRNASDSREERNEALSSELLGYPLGEAIS